MHMRIHADHYKHDNPTHFYFDTATEVSNDGISIWQLVWPGTMLLQV